VLATEKPITKLKNLSFFCQLEKQAMNFLVNQILGVIEKNFAIYPFKIEG
jgi:hypothetical protein